LARVLAVAGREFSSVSCRLRLNGTQVRWRIMIVLAGAQAVEAAAQRRWSCVEGAFSPGLQRCPPRRKRMWEVRLRCWSPRPDGFRNYRERSFTVRAEGTAD